ncbi:GbNV_gp09-like [Fopius arisanus]|nr:GbNV_gp09-like [Fopius arisanus]
MDKNERVTLLRAIFAEEEALAPSEANQTTRKKNVDAPVIALSSPTSTIPLSIDSAPSRNKDCAKIKKTALHNLSKGFNYKEKLLVSASTRKKYQEPRRVIMAYQQRIKRQMRENKRLAEQKLAELEAPPPRPMISEFQGNDYTIANAKFISSRGFYLSKFADYTVLTDSDFSLYLQYAPRSLKSVLESRWNYVMHIGDKMTPPLTRNDLYLRVIEGQILGYKFMECSVEGNESVYYGVVPSVKVANIDSNDRLCRFSMMSVYPRKLYIHLERQMACMCSDGCIQWKGLYADNVRTFTTCGKRIPWDDVYVMMGELDENGIESIKQPRECYVCAQCFNCSKSLSYCRKHQICKHSQSVCFDGQNTSLISAIKPSRIKRCRKGQLFE